jgi:AcrR family transcriptional regulator
MTELEPTPTAVDGRALSSKGAATRSRLLEAAEQVFADLGYHDASIVKITEAAGVAQGTFYLYFAGKKEIFEELMRDLNRRVRRAMAEGAAQGRTRAEKEQLGFRAFFRYTAQHRALYRIIRQAEFVSPETLRFHYEEDHRGLRRGAALGDGRRRDPGGGRRGARVGAHWDRRDRRHEVDPLGRPRRAPFGRVRRGARADPARDRGFGDGAVAALLAKDLVANEVLASNGITDALSLQVKVPGGERVPERRLPLPRGGRPGRDEGAARRDEPRELVAASEGPRPVPGCRLPTCPMSGVDPMLALDRAGRAGELADGDLVLLIAAGTGYTWAATVVRWGPLA